METEQNGPAPAFAELRDHLAALETHEAASVTGGHLDLAPGLWLSSDPDGGAAMGAAPAEGGFRLTVSGAGRSRWTSLGMALPKEKLAQGRYLGLFTGIESGALVSFTPALRYRAGSGVEDTAPPLPVLLPAGRHEDLAWIPIDPVRLEGAEACELNLFFHTDEVDALVWRLEPVVMS